VYTYLRGWGRDGEKAIPYISVNAEAELKEKWKNAEQA
jgi:hypothetical protein